MHRPRSGGESYKKGDGLGITTTTENGENDEVGEVVEELCWDREGGKAGGEIGKGDARRTGWGGGDEGEEEDDKEESLVVDERQSSRCQGRHQPGAYPVLQSQEGAVEGDFMGEQDWI